MAQEIRGYLIKRTETQEFGTSGFKKREIWLETEGQYAQTICIELQGEKVDLANGFKKNDLVNVKYNLNGRIWVPEDGSEPRCFNTIVGWKIDPIEIGANIASQPTQTKAAPPQQLKQVPEKQEAPPLVDAFEPVQDNDEPDDLPF